MNGKRMIDRESIFLNDGNYYEEYRDFEEGRPLNNMVDGEEKYKFKSVSQAVKETGISQGNISSCLTGKRKKAGGFNWFYGNIYQNKELI